MCSLTPVSAPERFLSEKFHLLCAFEQQNLCSYGLCVHPCRTDLEFITKMVDKTAVQRLKQVASTPFERCTYTRAIQLLEEAVKGGKKFEFPVTHAAFPRKFLV